MQTYCTIKGKSNSDDGIERLPEYIVYERRTISDDGFESFPEYHRDYKIQDYEDESESPSDYSEENTHYHEEGSKRFHSSSSGIQTYKDITTSITEHYSENAQSHHDSTQNQSPQPTLETTNATTPAKKKRRRPILAKNKRKNRKGKDREADPAAPESYKSPRVEDDEEGEEGEDGENWEDYLDAKREARVMVKVADDEEFAFRPQEIQFLGAFKKMTREQQKREMDKLLGSLMLGE
jgi:hypothetical protein